MKKVTIKIEDGKQTQEFRLEGQHVEVQTKQDVRFVREYVDNTAGIAGPENVTIYTVVVYP